MILRELPLSGTGYVSIRDAFHTRKIRNCARDLENSMISSIDVIKQRRTVIQQDGPLS